MGTVLQHIYKCLCHLFLSCIFEGNGGMLLIKKIGQVNL